MNEITKNNILLAMFLGYIDNACSEEGFLICPDTNYDIEINSMNFHKDWNWLMLVVDRINENDGTICHYSIFNKNQISIKIELDRKFYNYSESYTVSNKLEATFNACLNFVKWYNQNKEF